MAEYLVRITFARPAEVSDADWERVVARERRRGAELCRVGVIQKIWRIVGSPANVGIWVADTPEQLHSAIASLPAFRWADVEITVLSEHPLMPYGPPLPEPSTS